MGPSINDVSIFSGFSKPPSPMLALFHYYLSAILANFWPLPPHVEHLGAHEIDFLKLSSQQIVISVLNRPIKSQYFMSWNWSTYWTSCVCLTFKPYKLHRELQYTCNWNRTRLFRIQSSEMQYMIYICELKWLGQLFMYSSYTQRGRENCNNFCSEIYLQEDLFW